MDTFDLQGRVEIDARDSIMALETLEKSVKSAHAALIELDATGGKRSGQNRVAEEAATAGKKRVQAEKSAVSQIIALSKEMEREKKRAVSDGARAQKQALADAARAQTNAAKANEKLARDEQKAREKAAKEGARAEIAARKEVERESREVLRRQKEAGASMAREIEANWRREGKIVNRFGEEVKTVTGYLKDVERNTRDIKLDFDWSPAKGDLNALMREIKDAQKAANLKADVDTKEADTRLRELLRPLDDINKAAKIHLTIDGEGDVKKAMIDAGGGGKRGPPDGGDSEGGKSASELKKSLEDAASARDEVLEKLSQFATVSGASITGALGLATKTAADFDGALRNVNSIAQLSEKQLDGLSASILQIASNPQIRQGPKDLAVALYDVYSSGFSGKKALDILKMSAIGASAGLTDTATSGKTLMAVLNSGIKGAEAPKKALDTLFKIVDQGVLNFEQLSGAIGAVLPTAAKAGVSIQEVGAGIAVMTKSGQSASEATNDLLNLIMKLVNPSKEAAKAMDALGIKYGYSALQAKTLPGMLEEIQKKTKGQGDAIKKLLPDMQAQRAAMSLLKAGGKDYADSLGQMQKASEGAGAAAKALDQQNKGASAGLARMQKEVEILSITGGQSLLPALNSILKSLSGMFDWFNKLSPSTQDKVVKFTALAGVSLLLAGRIKGVVEVVTLLRTMMAASTVATGINTTATVLNGAAQNTTGLATGRLAGRLGALRLSMLASTAATGAQTTGFWSLSTAGSGAATKLIGAFGPWGVALAALVVTVWGIRTAILGTRDAGTMSADALIKKWGVLGKVWVAGGDALGNLISKLNGTQAASDRADSALAKLQADRKAGIKSPKSQVWLDAHPGFNAKGQKIDGSHALGLNRVPKDGYIAELHKDEAVLTAKEAGEWRSRSRGLQSKIGALQDKIDGRVIARSESRKRGTDTELLKWRIELRDLKHELSEVRKDGTAATNSLAKAQKASLSEASSAWHSYANDVTESADQQIAAMKATREAAAGLVQNVESKLLDSGAMADKGVAQGFYARVDALNKMLSSAPLQAKYHDSRSEAKRAEDRAKGYDPTDEGGSFGGPTTAREQASALGNRIADAATDTVARKSGTDIGGKCLLWVQMLLQRTLSTAENSAVRAAMSASGRGGAAGNAKSAGRRLLAKGFAKPFSQIGFEGLRPGDVLFDNDGENGHTGVYAGNGRVAENNAKRGARGAQRMSDVHHFVRGIDEVYRPGGWNDADLGANSMAKVAGGRVVLPPKIAIVSPQLDALLSQFTKGGLADVLTKQPRGKEGNELRRSMLLDLAKMQTTLNEEAARRGMKGEAATKWVEKVKGALYGLANFGEGAVNTKANREKVAAARKAGDEKRAAAGFDLFGELDAQNHRARATMSGLLGGKSDEEINTALEEQQKLLKHIADLRAAGYDEASAKVMANRAQSLERENRALEANAQALRAETLSTAEIGEAINKLPSLSDAAKEAQSRLRAALDDSSGSADDLKKVLAELGTDESTAPVLAVASAMETAGAAGDALRAKYGALFELLQKARAELGTRAKDEAERPAREALDARNAKIGELSGDLDYRARMATTFDPKKRRRTEIEDGAKRDGVTLDAKTIDQIVKRDQWVSTVEDLTSNLHGIFLDSFSNTEKGFKGMCDSILGSFAKMLQDMAAQYLANWVMQQIFGALLPGGGAAAGAVMGGGSGVNLRSGGDNLSGGFGLHGSHATGLSRVPFSGYRAELHQNEAVLTATQAEAWRRGESRKNAAAAGVAAASSAGSARAGSGAASDGGSHYHFHAPVTIQANDTKQFERQLPVSGGLPRREMQRRARAGLGM